MSQTLVLDDTNSRYHRQELITWWDQKLVRSGKVLVVGAGAIGNEVVKNLTLVGVGQITVCDMDHIEHSNLARCVFFREEHEGKFKAEVLAAEAQALNPEVEAVGLNLAVQRLGLAYLEQFDVIIGALDNREARAWVNQAARKLGKYWIDAAIEGLRGVVRTFGPEGACYECTLSDADYKQMAHRRSCALLAPEEMLLGGKTPTNATTASIVAGIQVQEAIKLLVGRSDLLALVGKVWSYTGDSMLTFVSNYSEDELCLAHDRYETLETIDGATTLKDFAKLASAADQVILDFEDELISLHDCQKCGVGAKSSFRSALKLGAGKCPQCDEELAGDFCTSISIDDPLAELTIASIGFALHDVVTVRASDSRQHFKLRTK